MYYTLSKKENYTLIELSGRVDASIVASAGSLVRRMDINYPGTVILDVDGLEDQREMFYHVALINTFKKEIDMAGGNLKIRATGISIKKYLSMTGLARLFNFDEGLVLVPCGGLK